MKKTFNAYSLGDRKFVDFIVELKIRTDVRGHLTYTLKGKTVQTGKSMSALVNKDQWDQYDAPIEERSIQKRINREKTRKKLLKPPSKKIKSTYRAGFRNYNEQIQRWLAEHNGLNFEKL